MNEKGARPTRTMSMGSAPNGKELPPGGRPGFAHSGDVDPDIIRAREMRERQMQDRFGRGGYGGGYHERDRFADRGHLDSNFRAGYNMDRGGDWRGGYSYDRGGPDGPQRGGYADRSFGGRGDRGDYGVSDRMDSNQARDKMMGSGDARMLRSGEDNVRDCRSQRSLSLGDSAAQSMREANDAMAAVASEREQLKNEDANPRKVEDCNNPAAADMDVRARLAPARTGNTYMSSSHDPEDEVFRAMAARRMQAQQDASPQPKGAAAAVAGASPANKLHDPQDEIFRAMAAVNRLFGS